MSIRERTWEEELAYQQKRVSWVISGIDYEKVNDWEQSFVESVEAQSQSGKMLSTPQMVILERIYRQKCL
jgi:hypothetical protein